MLETKENRVMVPHELMSNKERKTEMAKVLKTAPGFREIFGNTTTAGGG